MAAPSGAIYYTLDGSDPRLPGGAIAPNARKFTGAFVPPAGARIVARALAGGAWSPPARAVLGDSPPALAITEIMYHPDNPLGTNYHDEDFEFIELANPGTNTINLTGMRLGGGIDFVFPRGGLASIKGPTTNLVDAPGTRYTVTRPGAARSSGQNLNPKVDNLSVANYALAPNLLAPGERLVVVRNQAAFQARYGAGCRIVGEYSGALGNNGDKLILYNASGGPILDFKYQPDWLPLTDGQGFSLALIDPGAPASSWSAAASWRLSPYGGSPGQADPGAPALVP